LKIVDFLWRGLFIAPHWMHNLNARGEIIGGARLWKTILYRKNSMAICV